MSFKGCIILIEKLNKLNFCFIRKLKMSISTLFYNKVKLTFLIQISRQTSKNPTLFCTKPKEIQRPAYNQQYETKAVPQMQPIQFGKRI